MLSSDDDDDDDDDDSDDDDSLEESVRYRVIHILFIHTESNWRFSKHYLANFIFKIKFVTYEENSSLIEVN